MLPAVIRANSTDICRFVPERANVPFDSHQFVLRHSLNYILIVRVIYLPINVPFIMSYAEFHFELLCGYISVKQLLPQLKPLRRMYPPS